MKCFLMMAKSYPIRRLHPLKGLRAHPTASSRDFDSRRATGLDFRRTFHSSGGAGLELLSIPEAANGASEPGKVEASLPVSPYAARFRATTFTRRLPAALAYLARLSRHPGSLFDLGRCLGRVVLDDQLGRLTPIPYLPDELCRALGVHDVRLPPLGMFEPGNQDVAGLGHIASLAAFLEAKMAFEIGTFNGRTALTLAMNMPGGTVHTLDLAPEDDPALKVDGHDHLLIHRTAKHVYAGRPEAQRIVQHFADSARFDYSPYAGCCGLVYIDGAHSYEYVASDTEAAFLMLGERAAIIWDDYWRPAEAVVRYLDSRRDLELFRLPGSRLVLWLTPGARRSLATASEGGQEIEEAAWHPR